MGVLATRTVASVVHRRIRREDNYSRAHPQSKQRLEYRKGLAEICCRRCLFHSQPARPSRNYVGSSERSAGCGLDGRPRSPKLGVNNYEQIKASTMERDTFT